MSSHSHFTKHLLAVSLVLVMLASAVPLLAPELSPLGAVAAEGESIATYVWDGEGTTALASEAANWYQDIGGVITNDVLPTNNSNILYDATSVKACTWDLATEVYSFAIATGYTGTVIQGDVDIRVGEGGYYQHDGALTTTKDKKIISDGDFIQSGGSISLERKLNIVMNGDNTTLSILHNDLASITINGDVTFKRISGQPTVAKLTVSEGSVFTLTHQLNIYGGYESGTIPELYNDGTIEGSKLLIGLRRANTTMNFGNVNSPVQILLFNSADSSKILYLGSDTTIPKEFSVNSEHSEYQCVVDLNGHSLTAASVTVGERGNILWGEGTHRIGSLDTSAGASDFETSHIVMEQNGTVKLGAGQALHDLTVEEGVTATLQSDVTVSGLPLIYGEVEKNGYTLTAASPELTATPNMDATEDALYAFSAASTQPGAWSITTNAPWLDIDAAEVSGIPTNEHVGEWWLNVTLTNAATGSASVNVTITVANVAPEWTHVATPEGEAAYGNDYYFDLDATDEWHGLTYSLESNSPDLRVWLEGGVVEGTLRDAIPLIYVNVTADDGHGGVIHYNWTIAVHVGSGSLRFEIVHEASTVDPLRVYMTYRLLDGANESLIREIHWDFGNGISSYDAAPIHQYRQEAEYTVTCAIYDVFGGITHRSIIMTVGDPADPMGPVEKAAIWFQTTFWVLVGVLTVGLVAMFAYVHLKKTRGGVNPYLVGAIVMALAVAALYLGGLVTW